MLLNILQHTREPPQQWSSSNAHRVEVDKPQRKMKASLKHNHVPTILSWLRGQECGSDWSSWSSLHREGAGWTTGPYLIFISRPSFVVAGAGRPVRFLSLAGGLLESGKPKRQGLVVGESFLRRTWSPFPLTDVYYRRQKAEKREDVQCLSVPLCDSSKDWYCEVIERACLLDACGIMSLSASNHED